MTARTIFNLGEILFPYMDMDRASADALGATVLKHVESNQNVNLNDAFQLEVQRREYRSIAVAIRRARFSSPRSTCPAIERPAEWARARSWRAGKSTSGGFYVPKEASSIRREACFPKATASARRY